MKNGLVKSYSVFLFFYSVVLLVYVLAGSHGRLVLQNPDTIRALVIMILFVSTAIINLRAEDRTTKSKRFILLLLNFSTVIIVGWRTATLMIPDEFDVFSTFFFSVQVLGFILGVATIVRLLKT